MVERTEEKSKVKQRESADSAKRVFSIYKTKVGRNPSEAAIDYVNTKLADKSGLALKDEGSLSECSFERAVDALCETYSVGRGEVEEMITEFADSLSQTETASRQERVSKNRKLRKGAFYSLGILATVSLGSVALNYLHAAHEATKDAQVLVLEKGLQKDYAKKRAELDEYREKTRLAYFGGLEELTEIPKEKVSDGISDIAYNILDNLPHVHLPNHVIYDNKIGNVEIIASVYSFSEQWLVIRKSTKTNDLVSAYTYYSPDGALENMKPTRSIILEGGDKWLHVSHDMYKGHISRRSGDNVIYSSNNTSVYDQHAKDILNQFLDLYKKGPKVPDELSKAK